MKIQTCFNIRLRALSAFSGRDFQILFPLFLAGRVPFLFGFLVPLFFSSIILPINILIPNILQMYQIIIRKIRFQRTLLQNKWEIYPIKTNSIVCRNFTWTLFENYFQEYFFVSINSNSRRLCNLQKWPDNILLSENLYSPLNFAIFEA